MGYLINKVNTDHPLMDEIVYNCKLILRDIVVKNEEKAIQYETEEESLDDYERLKIINTNHAQFNNFPFSQTILDAFGYSSTEAKYYSENKWQIPEEDREELLQFAINYMQTQYVDKNDYYRALQGLPPYNTGVQYYIMYDTTVGNGYNSTVGYGQYIPSDFTGNIDTSLPLHMQDKEVISAIQENGGIDKLKQSYKGFEYTYINFLGDKAIDDYTARSAGNFDILYLPSVEPLVSQRFTELYNLNKEIYLTKTYQDAYAYNGTRSGQMDTGYYNQFMIIAILLQTFNDMIVDVPEYYIRRDIFDIRSVQYFLESYGVEFFDEIPLMYQIRIVKNLNKLIKYKSSNQNAYDILDIFDLAGTDIYKYYIYKNRMQDKWGDYTVGTKTSDKYNLQFISTKLGDSFDNYIKDNINRKPYDEITLEDKYWDGLQTHEFIKNKILDKDFTLEGTKYLSVEYHVSLSEYLFQLEYFLSLILHSNNYINDIKVTIPSISENAQLKVSDLFILLCLFSNIYENPDLVETKARIPKKEQPPYELHFKEDHDPIYHQIDGGKANADGGSFEDIENTQNQSVHKIYAFRNIYDMGDEDNSKESTYIKNDDGTYSVGEADYDFGDEDDPDSLDQNSYTVTHPADYDFNELTEDTLSLDINNPSIDNSKSEAIDPDVITIDDKWIDNEYENIWQLDANGGSNVEYSEVRPFDDYYDWKKKYIPEAYIKRKNKVYGFNIVDLNALNDLLSERKSRFQFEKGYSLDFLGCGDYINPTKVNSITDLINIYKTNKKCYDELISRINDTYQMDDKSNRKNPNVDNYDDYKIYTYVFEQLFTTDFDFGFYELSNGEQATSLEDILKDRSYILYKLYKKVYNEKNEKTKKDYLRNLTNDIITTLSYYISDKSLNYIFNFVSSNSFHALLHYMYLLINFFKSYKVYYLDPSVTYIVDDKSPLSGNNARSHDVIGMKKITYWKTDKLFTDDAFSINIEHDFYDYYLRDNMKEIIDIYGNYDHDPFDDLDYNGGDAETTEDQCDKSADGRFASDKSQFPYIMLNGGNAQLGRLDIWDLNGAGARDYQESLDVDGGRAWNASTTDNVSKDIFGIKISAEDYDALVDSSDNTELAFADTPKIIPLENNDNDERKDWFGTQGFNYIIDGGSAAYNQFISRTVHVKVIDHQVSSDIRIATSQSNIIQETEDGLYIKDQYTNWADFNDFTKELTSDEYYYGTFFRDTFKDIQVMSDEDALDLRINSIMETYIGVPRQILIYMNNDAFENSLKQYTDDQVVQLYNEFYGFNPYAWEDLTKN